MTRAGVALAGVAEPDDDTVHVRGLFPASE